MAKKPAKTAAAAAAGDATAADPKQRLRALAVTRNLLRRTSAASPAVALTPSGAAAKLGGRDIVKRGQRKSRYLFSFPGLLAPLSAGRVGELADLGTPNPLLYLEFPQGRMKLFGTHIYPENKYLSLQLTKSAKGVVCEDVFDSLIVFSDAWWIGLKEENPEELKLDLPKEFNEQKSVDCDFKGGAGGEFKEATGHKNLVKEYTEPLSPDDDDNLVESTPIKMEDTIQSLEATPVRQSARMAGKTLSYADPDSGDDPIASDDEVSEESDEKLDTGSGYSARRSIIGKTEDNSPVTSNTLASESAKVEQESLSSKRSKGSSSGGGILVQATVSSLFEKAAKNTSKGSAVDSPGPKGPAAKRQRLSSKATKVQVSVKEPRKKAAMPTKKKSGAGTASLRNKSQVEADEPEEISSDSQNDSDEDWDA